MYFEYGEKEIDYLKKKDKKLCEVIEKLGYIKREIDTDLFSSVVHHIVGQQISSKALETIWKRLREGIGDINANNILNAGKDNIQSYGISYRKAEYITDFANKVNNGEFDIDNIWQLSDEDAIKELTKLKGVGVWTAEMILLFCMGRKNILSYDDLAIRKGLKIVYHHREINKKLFEKYKKRYSPYGSVASLYLWKVANLN